VIGFGTPLIGPRLVNDNASAQARSMERLATGFRINRGSDDPAGLITSENLRAALAEIEAEGRVLDRADHVAATADAAMGEISELLARAESLAAANANSGGMSDAERDANQMEIDSIVRSVDRLASTTSFNGDRLLDGSATLAAGGESVTIDDVSSTAIGKTEDGGETYTLADVTGGRALSSSRGDFATAYAVIRGAREYVGEQRARIGAWQRNVVAPARRTAAEAYENVAAADSVIRDTDYAKETAALSRASTLHGASLWAVGEAAALPGRALGLLG
jgi:flagellin